MLSPFDIAELLSNAGDFLGILGVEAPHASKKAKVYSFGVSWKTAKNVELMTQLKERFAALQVVKNEDDLAKELASLSGSLGKDCKCDQHDIGQMLKNIKSFSRESSTEDLEEEKKILEDIQMQLANHVAEHAKKIKGKLDLVDVKDFYNQIIEDFQPLSKLNPEMHKALMTDVVKDLAELEKDMDKHVVMVANKSIKEHESKALQHKWASRSLLAVGVVLVIAGACTSHMGGMVLIGLGVLALSAATKFYHSQKGHETSIKHLKAEVKSAGDVGKDANLELKSNSEILKPVNDFVEKLRLRTEKIGNKSSL